MLINRLSTLSHSRRMDVFRLLMRRCPDPVPASEIADALGLKASTASAYLSALTASGLITQRRDGTRLLYAANLDAVRDVVTDLFMDCCRGRADLCPSEFANIMKAMTPTQDRTFNVLFICTGNSARSIFAETILRDVAGDRFTAHSAGTLHRSDLNPYAVEVLKTNGHTVGHLRSKNIAEFQGPNAPKMDFVFTVCDRAANEDCPAWQGQPVSGHWGVPDPVTSEGTDAEKRLAFRQTYGALHNRIAAFAALSFEALDRVTLQKHIDKIGSEPIT